MTDSEGLEVVLTPVQLAALLEGEDFEGEGALSNRLWGAAALAGGAIELIGAAALLLTPEPTMVTKVAGGALAVHGADTSSTALVQIVSGRTRTTLTSQAATAAAEALGAEPGTAATVGMAIDIAVPLLAGFAGAARVIAIHRGVVSLIAEESAGGHTIARHVARTEAQLQARLAAQKAIPVASSFRTLEEAERIVSLAMRANKGVIKEWAKSALAGQTKAITFEAGRSIGYGVVRSSGKLAEMRNVLVVVKKVRDQNRIYYVLTAYPKL